MTRRLLACLFVLSTALPALAADQTWYAQAVSEGSAGISITYFWSKGRSLRALTVLDGRPLVTMVHRDWYYVVDELSGKGMAIQRGQQALREDAGESRPFGQEAVTIAEEGAEKVRTERVGPQEIDVWRLTDAKSRREVWTTKDRPDIPIRVEIFDRNSSEERVVRYLGWNWTLQIPERFFRPDARVELERMSYEEYLHRTAGGVMPLPVLYSSLLHGKARVGE